MYHPKPFLALSSLDTIGWQKENPGSAMDHHFWAMHYLKPLLALSS